MNLAEELKARGLIEQSSAPIEEILSKPRVAYHGVDPTADSLHIGHLVPLLLMKRLGDAGHKLIFLVGGGTGMIGDPKEKGERAMLDEKTVAKNAHAIEKQLKRIFGGTKFTMVDNASWLMKAKLVPFLRDIGKHFTVNDLIKRELIAKRLAAPDESISYTEFTYALLQGLDFLTLHEEFGADLQVGGSEQWTNMLSGADLIRKKAGAQAYVLSIPLVTDSTGKKFGKSEGNAIWLDAKKTSPFLFYQFWLQLPDDGIEKYLNAYTFLAAEQIQGIMAQHNADRGARGAQETLASQVTELVHGPAAAAAAAAATDALFGTTPFHELSSEARAAALAEAPSLKIPKKNLTAGVSLAEALVSGGIASSKNEARRLIEQKAITLAGLPIQNADQKIYEADLPGGFALIRKGKRDVLVLAAR